ncbi:hypothetical protein [Chondromyces apiculatus]|uniref:hypothetical protein n=1 Tax=Chondromyces apiculatus TaxID=51 RepID=UPI0012DD801C|nr:hypothetical protein [Chondromyces apiculatus]
MAVPEEGEDDPAIEESPGEESEEAMSEDASEEAMSEDATSEVSHEIQSEPANAVACGGSENWCLARCSRTGAHLHVVGHWTDLTTGCAVAGEAYCRQMGLGYRTFACWGHL